jgi:uncharacterized protein YdhG (YjbR/CyaY superfamily)
MQKWRFFSRKIWKVEIILQDTFSNAMRSSTNEIDQYISSFPGEVQIILEQIRTAIRQAAPDAEETIKYAMPTYVLEGNLVHFAGYKNHIGFYPAPSGIEAFKKELSVYKGAKGSVQFPLNKPMPLDLITRIVKFRVKVNLEKALRKKL